MSESNTTFCTGWEKSHGAYLVDFHGWLLPLYFQGVLAEHRAVREEAGLFNISHMGRLRVAGKDALAFSQWVFTNDLSSIRDGDALYGFVLNEKGGVLDDVIVYRVSPEHLDWVVNAANREKVLSHLRELSRTYAVEIVDETFQTALIALQGPGAQKALEPLVQGVDLARLPYFSFARAKAAGVEVFLSATGYTGEDGFEIKVALENALLLWESLVRRPGVAPCGLGARDLLRLEAGLPLHGQDIGPDVQPKEAGLAWALGKEKDFFGKNALQENPPRRLIGLTLEGRAIPRFGAAVFAAGGEWGKITSGAWSPSVQAGIALALGRREGSDGPFTVGIRGQKVPARRVKLPWVRHITRKKRQ